MSQPVKTPSFTTPDMNSWFKSRLTQLVEAPDHDTFSSAFDSLFAQDKYMSGISCNGVNMTRDVYKQHLASYLAVGGKVAAHIELEKFVDVPFGDGMHKEWVEKAKKEQDVKGGSIQGSIGAFFTVTISREIRIRAGPMQCKLTGSMNAQIIAVEARPGASTGADMETSNLRINLVNESIQVQPGGIHLSPIPGQYE